MPGDPSSLWKWFAQTQCASYSPLYERICTAVAGDARVLELVEAAPPRAHLPNVLLAAVHYLLLGGADDPLAEVYEGRAEADPGPLFIDFVLRHRTEVATLMAARHTNTNEVGRSALIGPALTHVARTLGGPIGLVDVGCSAGLNLLCDRYLLDYGPAGRTGPPGAAVRIECEVVGGDPPVADLLPEIGARVGLDRDPVDLDDESAFRWQLACVWPDTGRLPRTRLAMEEARKAKLSIVAGDAVGTLPEVLGRVPERCLPVVVTTWALAYLSAAQREAFSALLADAGPTRPLAWVSAEGPGVVPYFAEAGSARDATGIEPSVLGLAVFTGGPPQTTLLAAAHPHGRWLDWKSG